MQHRDRRPQHQAVDPVELPSHPGVKGQLGPPRGCPFPFEQAGRFPRDQEYSLLQEHSPRTPSREGQHQHHLPQMAGPPAPYPPALSGGQMLHRDRRPQHQAVDPVELPFHPGVKGQLGRPRGCPFPFEQAGRFPRDQEYLLLQEHSPRTPSQGGHQHQLPHRSSGTISPGGQQHRDRRPQHQAVDPVELPPHPGVKGQLGRPRGCPSPFEQAGRFPRDQEYSLLQEHSPRTPSQGGQHQHQLPQMAGPPAPYPPAPSGGQMQHRDRRPQHQAVDPVELPSHPGVKGQLGRPRGCPFPFEQAGRFPRDQEYSVLQEHSPRTPSREGQHQHQLPQMAGPPAPYPPALPGGQMQHRDRRPQHQAVDPVELPSHPGVKGQLGRPRGCPFPFEQAGRFPRDQEYSLLQEHSPRTPSQEGQHQHQLPQMAGPPAPYPPALSGGQMQHRDRCPQHQAVDPVELPLLDHPGPQPTDRDGPTPFFWSGCS